MRVALISEPDPSKHSFSFSPYPHLAIPVHEQSGRFALLPVQDTPESTLRRQNYGHQEGSMSGDTTIFRSDAIVSLDL